MSRFWRLAVFAWLGVLPLDAAAQDTAEPGESADEEELTDTPPPGPAAKQKPAPYEPPDDEGPEPPLVVPAPDELSGHFRLSPSVGLAIPFGDLEAGVPASEAMRSGWAFGLDATYGLSRTVAVGAFGQLLRLGVPSSCSDCEAQSLAVGALVRYHLVQGVRFDPWMSAGLGYRSTTFRGGGSEVTYSGFEWLHLMVGGDWYAFDKLGFGPYLELDLGRYGARSPGEIGRTSSYWVFGAGLRVTLDLPGK